MFLGNAAGRRARQMQRKAGRARTACVLVHLRICRSGKAWLFFGGTSITQPSSMAFSDASSADVRLGLLSPRAVLRREADRSQSQFVSRFP